MAFTKATKKNSRLRLALLGPPGSGKTFTALRIARGLVGPTGRIALGDTERGSASKYADRFNFDAQDMETFGPRDYVALIQEAERGGYDALIIDSLSHAWMGKGGALEMVDNVAKASKSKNSFDAWRTVTPEHNNMVDAILRARLHIIVTMRVKTEYVVEDVNGKKTPRKVGMAPVQRDGLEYEFDVVGDMDGADLAVTKTRCSALAKAVVVEPGEKLGETLRAWLTDGVAEPLPAQGERRAPLATAAHDARQDGHEPGGADDVAAAITSEAEQVTKDDFPALYERARSLPVGSRARDAAGDAVKAAAKRLGFTARQVAAMQKQEQPESGAAG
ncbi:MAG: ATP-binding protein [Myxococcaceae bacterium]|nr:MAG: ATP-binding protein [Myxococcaceae bacterium]